MQTQFQVNFPLFFYDEVLKWGYLPGQVYIHLDSMRMIWLIYLVINSCDLIFTLYVYS